MTSSIFRKAERKQARLRLALCGPAGSGKTYSALLIANGIAPDGRIALIDTERGSGELYADLTAYDVAPLAPPFTPASYIKLIREAEQARYDVLILDSLSHAWAGEGGVLDMHDKATSAERSGNSYTAWRNVTPQHNALVDAIIGADLHIIATMRTKTAYDLVDDGKGKKKPIKIGLAPVQRDGLEYEFTLVVDMSVDGHVATATKDRTRLFDGQHFVPGPGTGEALREWLEQGKSNDGRDLTTDPPEPPVDHAQINSLRKALSAQFVRLGWDRETQAEWISGNFSVPTVAMRDPKQIEKAVKMLAETKPAQPDDEDIPF